MPKNDITETKVVNVYNKNIVAIFEKLIRHIKVQIDISPTTKDLTRNTFRLKQIQNALDVIKKYPDRIKSGEQLKDLRYIGPGTVRRINEIIKTGTLQEIKTDGKEEKYSKAVEHLKEVYGIGPRTAYELVTKYGIKTVKQLKDAYNNGTIELNPIILLGLKYYKVYQENIPRKEIDQVKEYLERISTMIDPELRLVIAGSYRRKKQTSGDIDVLITHPKVKTKLQIVHNKNNYLEQLVNRLKKDRIIKDDLTDPAEVIKYMGFAQFRNKNNKPYPVRRIDIRYVPFPSFPSALLYFTGSGEFNQKMRKHAIRLGYKLNEYGLYKKETGKRIKIESEKDIFDILGMEYLPPEKRN